MNSPSDGKLTNAMRNVAEAPVREGFEQELMQRVRHASHRSVARRVVLPVVGGVVAAVCTITVVVATAGHQTAAGRDARRHGARPSDAELQRDRCGSAWDALCCCDPCSRRDLGPGGKPRSLVASIRFRVSSVGLVGVQRRRLPRAAH